MKKILLNSLILYGGVVFITSNASASPITSIGATDEPETKIYAIGASESNMGVYTLSLTSNNPQKISGDTPIQYRFENSGGTFVSKECVYGTHVSGYGWSATYYAIKATAEGTAETGRPWGHTFMKSQDDNSTNYNYSIKATDMTYNPIDGKIYGIFTIDSYGYEHQLGTYDGESGTVTLIGSKFPNYTKYDAIACDPDGQLYVINGYGGNLYTIDATNGLTTLVGPTGVSTDAANQSAAIDPVTGKMYWAAQQSYKPGALYEINIETGTATKLYDFDSADQRFNAIFIPGPDIDDKAPAATEDLAATFTGTGTDVKVTFTAPSKTHDGVDGLSGELNYEISVDNVAVDNDKITAGAKFDKTFSMAAGSHTVAVVFSNTAGTGAKAKIKTYAGYDTPTNISDLKADVDGNKVTITWTAPQGVNGGIIDNSKLSYTVTRNPGAVEVASGLKECTVTDNIPEGYATGYSWTVTVKYEGLNDQSMTTENVIAGYPYDVPYSQNFDEATSLETIAYKQYNNDANSPQWEIKKLDGDNNQYAEIAHKYYGQHNDYLFTSPINFYKGVTYTLKFKIASSIKTPEKYEQLSDGKWGYVPVPYDLTIFLTRNQSEKEEDKVADIQNIQYSCTAEDAGKFIEQTMTFTPQENGVFNIAFLENTARLYDVYNSELALRLDDIEISAEFPTPAAISDLTAEQAEKGSRDIKLTFTTPSKDTEGKELPALTKIEIFRGDELLNTLKDDLGLGVEMSYTDEKAPRGLQNYKVISYTVTSQSAAATATAMSGMLNELLITDITVPETVPADGTADVTVTIMNDGAEMQDDYTVYLLINGEKSEPVPGEAINPDEEKTCTLTLQWSKELPEKSTIQAVIGLDGDEKPENNTSDVYNITFEQKPDDSLANVNTSDIKVTTANGTIVITGANGMRVNIYTPDGRCIASQTARGDKFSISLDNGVYIVTVDKRRCKVII